MYRIEDARGRYTEYAKGTVGSQSLDGMKVVLDCANGAAYLIGPWIFRELGATVIKAHAEPDGYNIKVSVTDVGDRYVIERMCAEGFNLGGEKSGHVIFMDDPTTGDGIITALQVLKLMKRSGSSIRELASCMTEFPQLLVSLPVSGKVSLADLTLVNSVVAAVGRLPLALPWLAFPATLMAVAEGLRRCRRQKS